MSNIYGVANPVPPAVLRNLDGAVDKTLTADTPVALVTYPTLKAIAQGTYFPMLWCTFTAIMGAIAPTALAFTLNVDGGSASDTYTVEPGLLTATTERQLSFQLLNISTSINWWVAAHSVAINGLSSGQPSTVKLVGSRVICYLVRGAD